MVKSITIVFFQILFIVFLMRTGSVIPSNKVLLFLEIIFAVFGFWGMAAMKFRFSIFPEPLKNSSLVTSGPYKFVRHPIYTSILFITLIWLINDFSLIRCSVWILLIIILNIKSEHEEKILTGKFPGYENYKLKSKKIIPFLY
jgi:protein-S-isoprenylcysteine O-methyltransferase Ste14